MFLPYYYFRMSGEKSLTLSEDVLVVRWLTQSLNVFLQLVVMIGVRKCLDWIFTQRELKILDDTLPEFSRKKRMESEGEDEEDEEGKVAKKIVRWRLLLVDMI